MNWMSLYLKEKNKYSSGVLKWIRRHSVQHVTGTRTRIQAVILTLEGGNHRPGEQWHEAQDQRATPHYPKETDTNQTA